MKRGIIVALVFLIIIAIPVCGFWGFFENEDAQPEQRETMPIEDEFPVGDEPQQIAEMEPHQEPVGAMQEEAADVQGIEKMRTDFRGTFWSSNSHLKNLYLKAVRQDQKTHYDLMFVFDFGQPHVLYFGDKKDWKDYFYTLTIRTSNGELALEYFEFIRDVFNDRQFVSFAFGTDTCTEAFTDYKDPTMKQRNCVVNLDEGSGYFEMRSDDLTDAFN